MKHGTVKKFNMHKKQPCFSNGSTSKKQNSLNLMSIYEKMK